MKSIIKNGIFYFKGVLYPFLRIYLLNLVKMQIPLDECVGV